MTLNIKISDFEILRKSKSDFGEIARRLADIFVKMVFIDGIFHGDPHPGNIFILKKDRLCFIDFGITGRLSEDMQEKLVRIISGIAYKDSQLIIKTMFSMNVISENSDINAIRFALDGLIDEYAHLALGEIEVGKLITEVVGIASKNGVRIPSNFMLLSKSFLMVESIGRELEPDFLLIPYLKPYLMEFIYHRVLNKERIGKKMLHFLDDSIYLVEELPFRLNSIVRKLEGGKLRVNYKHEGLEELQKKIDSSSNRIAVSLIISSIIIGSSLIMFSEKGFLVYDYPLLGLGGFIVAGFFGLILVVSIFRSGKL